MELQWMRALAHVVRTRALTPSTPPRDIRRHPDLVGPAMRRFQRFPIRCHLYAESMVLIDDLLRNRKGAPAPLMRDRQSGPPPLIPVGMVPRSLVEPLPGELHEVRHVGTEVLIRFLAGHLV